HDPAHALGDEVEAASLTVGPIPSEAGELGVDEARVLAGEDVVSEPGPLHDRRAVVLDEDVHQGHEAEEDGPTGAALVVEGEAPLTRRAARLGPHRGTVPGARAPVKVGLGIIPTR